MVKEKKEERKDNIRNDKRIGLRLYGFDLSTFQILNVKPLDVFRCGLYTETRKRRSREEVKLLSEIFKVQNHIIESELKLRADKLLLRDLQEDLQKVRGITPSKLKSVVESMSSELDDYLDDERYVDFQDLSNFYELKRDAITLIALRNGLEYDDVVDIFDEHFAGLYEKGVCVMGVGDSGVGW